LLSFFLIMRVDSSFSSFYQNRSLFLKARKLINNVFYKLSTVLEMVRYFGTGTFLLICV
jgi:hypothetical protein